jgi:hypothetical protein
MSDDSSVLRRIQRLAQRAFGSPEREASLKSEGISLGYAKRISGDELLAAMESVEDDGGPSVTVTVHVGAAPAQNRAEIEEPICEFVEQSALGTWVGGGEGSIGSEHFFDVTFSVHDPETAYVQLRDFMSRAFPEMKVEIWGDDVVEEPAV